MSPLKLGKPPSTDPVVRHARELIKTLNFDGDVGALREFNHRLAATARHEGVITYSDLVRGVVMHLPNVQNGAPFELGVPEWTDLHRAIIGECLGRLACDSYLEAGFLISSVAVSKTSMEPSEGFRALLEKLGMVGSRRDSSLDAVWLEHLRGAYQWCAAHPTWPSS
jgi:hypothetical protein